MQPRGEGMECQASVAGFDHLGLKVTQAVNLMTGFFEDFELVGLSLGTQVGDQNLAVFLVGIGVDCRNDRPALPPEHQVVTFGVALEVVIEIDAPFGVDLVMHADIIPGLWGKKRLPGSKLIRLEKTIFNVYTMNIHTI